MAYLLNGSTIKSPGRLTREPIEVSTDHLTIGGDTKRDITARKWKYVLEYDNLNTTDANTIYTIYDLKATVSFQSTETNLMIGPVNVHVNVSPREYKTLGSDYLVSLTLVLTEVEE